MIVAFFLYLEPSVFHIFIHSLCVLVGEVLSFFFTFLPSSPPVITHTYLILCFLRSKQRKGFFLKKKGLTILWKDFFFFFFFPWVLSCRGFWREK